MKCPLKIPAPTLANRFALQIGAVCMTMHNCGSCECDKILERNTDSEAEERRRQRSQKIRSKAGAKKPTVVAVLEHPQKYLRSDSVNARF